MGIEFGIRFSRTDLNRWLSAVKRVQAFAFNQSKELPLTHATDYYQLVYKNIIEQRYGASYPAYSERYAKWKSQVASTMDFWRLYDALLKNLRAFKVEGEAGETAYMGGIMDTAFSKGKSIAMYGRVVESGEFGAGIKKPRPLFWPTALEYSYKPWKERGYKSLDKIKDAWR